MPELFRATAFGVLATLMTAAGAIAAEEGANAGAAPVSAVTQEAVALVSDGVAAKAADDKSCPTIAIAPDADTRRDGGAKATLDGLARDCANLGAETIVKVALVGESERKKGGPSAVEAPLTIQIKDGEGREIETRRVNLKVEMPEGVQKVSFRHVEENVSLPPPTADGYANWIIVVALDPSAEAEEPEVAAVDEAAEEPAPAAKRSRWSRGSKSARSRSVRARTLRSAKTRAGRERVVLQPQPQQLAGTRAADQGPPQAQVQTVFQPRPAAPAQARQTQPAQARQAQPAPARQAQPAQGRQPAAAAYAPPQSPASSGSDSPWKRMATDFNDRRERGKPQPAQPQQRGRPAPSQAAAQSSTAAQTNTN